MNPKKTRFEIFNSRVKNNPIVAVLIIFGTIVIAVSTFTNAAKNLLGLLSKPEIIHIHNKWVTQELTNPFNKKDKFRLHFDLEMKGDVLLGVIRKTSTADWYDITLGIMGGTIKGNTISFYTTERSLFGKETITYKNLYHGSVSKDEIQFVLQSDRPWGYPPQNFIAKQE
jgi:hypothetical protein